MTTSFLIKVGGSKDLAHVPGPPEQTLGNQFVSTCRCGKAGKSGSNPSAAYKATQDHADLANYEAASAQSYDDRMRAPMPEATARVLAERLASGTLARRTVSPGPVAGSPAPQEPAPAPEPRPAIPRQRERPPAPSGSKTCGCGCGELCKGTFRPGHDAKLLGRLGAEVRERKITVREALTALEAWPKLHAKLTSRLVSAGVHI